MADAEPRTSQVNIDSVRISGALTDLNAASLREAIRACVARTLRTSELPRGAEQARDIRCLKLRLPPHAGEAEVAEALASAIAGALKGKQP